MRKRAAVIVILALALFTLSANDFKSGITFKATDRTWAAFTKYCSTTTGKADAKAQEILRGGKESAFGTYTKILTFYTDGSLIVSNTTYTEIYRVEYCVSEGRVLIPRSASNTVFGTDYPITAGENIDYIHFGYIADDGMSMSTNPNIIENGNYFMLYR